jgi:hypothetical protein
MGETLHSYHPTKQPGRGVHALTTTDDREAFTMLHAIDLRDALRDVLAWRDTIIASVGSSHGNGVTYRQLAEALYLAEIVLSMTERHELPEPSFNIE